MYKKTITFEDYNGVSRTEDHYFNINDAEAMKLELGEKGGLTEKIQRIIQAQDIPTIIEVFDDLIMKSYGVKSLDGREFIKSPEITKKFLESGAYPKLFMELCSVEGAAAEFVNGILPNVPTTNTNTAGNLSAV